MKPKTAVRLRKTVRWLVPNALLALLFTWIGYRISVVEPKLSYTVSSARPIVFDNAFVPELRAFHGGEELRGDVFLMTVWVWNRGSELIQPPFRRPPVLRTDPPVRMLSALVLRQSYADCGFRIDDRRREQGVLGLSWEALARNDGAAIEIVYAGSRDTVVHIDGGWSSQHLMPHVPFIRRSDYMLGQLAIMLVGGIGLLLIAVFSDVSLPGRLAIAVLWVLILFVLAHAWFFGVPRAIDVGWDIDGDTVPAPVTTPLPARSTTR